MDAKISEHVRKVILAGFKSMQHQVNHCQTDHGLTTRQERFVVLAQPAILAEPTKGSFDDPPPGQNNEAMCVATFDDLYDAAKCTSNPVHKCPSISSINKDGCFRPETFFPPLLPRSSLFCRS